MTKGRLEPKQANEAALMKDRRTLLQTLWIFAVLNYLYCDVVSLTDSHLLKQYLTGTVEGLQMSQQVLLSAAVLMEISIGMVVLSRVLQYTPNRWANMIAAVITTLAQVGSLFLGKPTPYYLFFSAFEIAATVSIFVIALRWRRPEPAHS